jgi:hypothetical protein
MPNEIVKRRPKRKSGRRDNTQQAVSKYAGDAYSLARRTFNGLNAIRKLINIEIKHFDSYGTVSFTDSSTTVLIANIPQGITQQTRVGDSVRLQSVELRMYVQASGSSIKNDVCRAVIVRDNAATGSAFTSADLWEVATANYETVSPYKFSNTDRFSIVWDEMFNLDATSLVSKVFYVKIPHNGHMKYVGAGGSISDAGNGVLYLVCVGNKSSFAPAAYFFTRILYTDD